MHAAALFSNTPLALPARGRVGQRAVHAGFRSKFGDSGICLPTIRASLPGTAEPPKISSTGFPTSKKRAQEHSSAAARAEDLVTQKLYALMETAADRAEMHDIIGTQRNGWNHLLFNSVNSMTLAASISAGLSLGSDVEALRISSVVLYLTATMILLAINKLQPSQLAEEQRNAARLFRRLERKIRTTLALGAPSPADVDDALNRVLALDKAYPLSLIPGMLEKFPEKVEPAVWWPKHSLQSRSSSGSGKDNGWSRELEDVSANVLETLKRTDTADYLTDGVRVLNVNKVLAISGPSLTGLAAVGAALMNSAPALGPLPVFFAIVGGALATAVNTLEHGAQVGMIFEMFRNCAGYYRNLEEEIELNLGEPQIEARENGEMFELKMALQLGRSLADLRKVNEDGGVYAGRIF